MRMEAESSATLTYSIMQVQVLQKIPYIHLK